MLFSFIWSSIARHKKNNTMKTTKRIKALANEAFMKDVKNPALNWITKEDTWRKDSMEKELNNIKSSLLNGTFYIRVDTVSSSGMSRKISMAYIKNNKLHKITDPFILKLAGCDKNGRIHGCGMDMLFHAQYSLYQNLHDSYKQANYQKRLTNYNYL